MPGKPGQTPMVFIRAGGIAVFSPECVKALAACGLSPDDFGTYDQVKARLSAARKKVREYEAAKKNKGKLPPKPNAHDRYLAGCEGGHLRQNALFQRGKERGDFCQNEKGKLSDPNTPGAAGYHTDWAPCGPHFVGTKRKGGKVGTTHWLVGKRERAQVQGRKAGTKVSVAEVRELGLDVAKLTAGKVTKKDLDSLEKEDKLRQAEDKSLREKRAKALQKTKAGSPSGPGAPKSKTQAMDKAAECIDAFVEAGMQAMRDRVISEFGTDEAYKKSKKALEKAEKDALAEKNKAAAELAKAGKLLKKKQISYKKDFEPILNKYRMATARHKEAQVRNQSAHCLHEQAKALKAFQDKNKAQPGLSGSLPSKGGKSTDKRLPYVETKKTGKSSKR